MSTAPRVFVVDDDAAVRSSLRMLLETEGLQVADFESADAFLASCVPLYRGCLITDIRMPGLSGLELQRTLDDCGIQLPVIVLTGHADVPAAVQSLKAGALDFIEKPFDPETLLQQVQLAIGMDAARHADDVNRRQRTQLFERLTPREREVIDRIATGESNKVAALELAISERTVELHRGRGMKKLGVRTVAELVRLMAN